MNRHILALAITSFLFTVNAHAGSLGQFDARSMAMGGAGVAGANSANAAAFNPALIASDEDTKSFSMIPLVLNIEGYDENNFIDNIENAEKAINGSGGLDEIMQSIAFANIEPDDPYNPLLADAAAKTTELRSYMNTLNKSRATVNAATGLAVQFGKIQPIAVVFDGGAITSTGLKFSLADTTELDAYTAFMQDGIITTQEYTALNNAGLADNSGSGIIFTSFADPNKELHSLVEVVGASYIQLGVSVANHFDFAGQKIALGVTPKVIEINAVKFHQSVEAQDIEVDEVFSDENITSKTDFNADVGMTLKPIDTMPLTVGVVVRNLFSRSYELKKSQAELDLEANLYPEAAADLANFNLVQDLKIEPQLTAGIAYTLPAVNLLADIDLNEAEVLGQRTQELSMGAEFSAKFLKLQIGHTISIGGDDVQDSSSAGFTAGFLDVAAVFTGDHIGGVIQTSFSF